MAIIGANVTEFLFRFTIISGAQLEIATMGYDGDDVVEIRQHHSHYIRNSKKTQAAFGVGAPDTFDEDN